MSGKIDFMSRKVLIIWPNNCIFMKITSKETFLVFKFPNYVYIVSETVMPVLFHFQIIKTYGMTMELKLSILFNRYTVTVNTYMK